MQINPTLLRSLFVKDFLKITTLVLSISAIVCYFVSIDQIKSNKKTGKKVKLFKEYEYICKVVHSARMFFKSEIVASG